MQRIDILTTTEEQPINGLATWLVSKQEDRDYGITRGELRWISYSYGDMCGGMLQVHYFSQLTF